LEKNLLLCCCVVASLITFSCSKGKISGELIKWHRVEITFNGPQLSEGADPNPFTDYRLDVQFINGGDTLLVPGFYAADGNAAETGAVAGDAWRVCFMPNKTGEWHYNVSFRTGPMIAVNDDADAGDPTAFDGAHGTFVVRDADSTGRGFYAKGALQYVGERYLKFAETGDYFLKGGADSPENFLAYYEFDDAERIAKVKGENRQGEAAKVLFGGSHKYEPHAGDWHEGDPSWQNGKGKNIIGALNYLAGKGMNSVYFLTMNVGGDGKDVWPWTGYDERYRFDCSKLDQWDIVFSHMDKLGLMQHVVLTETENEALFEADEGLSTSSGFADSRKLYYREIIARFGWHPAMVFNIGEENGWDNEDVKYGAANSDVQRKMFADYLKAVDPYDHPVVVHTLPGRYDEIYQPLLGHPTLDGVSLQIGNQKQTHSETLKWLGRSAATGRQWFACLDEIGPAGVGVKPDADDYWHDDVRRYSLWGNLMAGGAGVEWYFGYKFANNDLNCEDWRSRDHIWELTKIALDFFQTYLPFAGMAAADELTTAKDDYCLARAGEIYAIYLPHGGVTKINLAEGDYAVQWYNPRQGGDLMTGKVRRVSGTGWQSLGHPPSDGEKDWAVLIKRM